MKLLYVKQLYLDKLLHEKQLFSDILLCVCFNYYKRLNCIIIIKWLFYSIFYHNQLFNK